LKIHKDRKTYLAFLPLSFVLANLKSENYFELDISYYKPIEQADVIVNRTNETILLFDFITNGEFAKISLRSMGYKYKKAFFSFGAVDLDILL
jgi:hypothetical protein